MNAKRAFLALLRERFNSGVRYRGCFCKWDKVILRKAQELARFLTKKTEEISFEEPCPKLERIDTQKMRKRILRLSQSEAEALGIGKSTLHYLRKHARSQKSFKVYKKVAEKLNRQI